MDRRRFLKQSVAFAAAAASPGSHGAGREAAEGFDFTHASVVVPTALSSRERAAVRMLVEEVEKRSGIRWAVGSGWPPSSPAVLVGRGESLSEFAPRLPANLVEGSRALRSEGFALRGWRSAGGPAIAAVGRDERGVLFGVGRLLRWLRMSAGRIRADGLPDLSSSPQYALRGHQLGYRPKTNSYDGWTVPLWEQCIRDLAVFGANAIELIPPRSDDARWSPHFTLPPEQMMIEMSRLADRYGLDVWIWYPAMDKDYTNPATVQFALEEWGRIFQTLPRINAVFVPGGDPGHTRPRVLLSLLEKQAASLHRYHPGAGMWVSPQSFGRDDLGEFLAVLEDERPRWLTGVVYGPQVRVDLATLRKQVPGQYPIRLYPDITHSLGCQFPVPDWDAAYALTEGREVINPRPVQFADIFRLEAPHTIGFIAYSEGCNDDVNKAIWSSLGWDAASSPAAILSDYSRYFIGEDHAGDFAEGLFALERNWCGRVLTHQGVDATLKQFQAMERRASAGDHLNWRFQQALYRSYFDAYVRRRLVEETSLEERALAKLQEAWRVGATLVSSRVTLGKAARHTKGQDLRAILSQAEEILGRPGPSPAAARLRTRILELGDALYRSICMQLSVERYGAESVSRGANLDTLDAPLTSVPWLKRELARIRALPSAGAQIEALNDVLERTNPGPGGFYDDLGDLNRQLHLVRGAGWRRDPEFRASSLIGFDYPDSFGDRAPMAWKRWAESLYDAPLEMHYTQLDSAAVYKIRVVYSGDERRLKIRLSCGDGLEVHPLMAKPWPPRPLEFDVPRQATANGELRLVWNRETGLGHNGRGCQVAEVWLIKK